MDADRPKKPGGRVMCRAVIRINQIKEIYVRIPMMSATYYD
jgi:hypothetical protein